jgi:hypothetical protein
MFWFKSVAGTVPVLPEPVFAHEKAPVPSYISAVVVMRAAGTAGLTVPPVFQPVPGAFADAVKVSPVTVRTEPAVCTVIAPSPVWLNGIVGEAVSAPPASETSTLPALSNERR